VQVINAIVARAITGDISAAKVLLSYTVGKPGNSPNPDLIEREEWDNYQKDAMTLDEMKQALGRLPCYLGNEIVSTARPYMSASWANALASKLMENGEGRGPRGESKESCQNQSADSVYETMLASYQASMAGVGAPLPDGELQRSRGKAVPTSPRQDNTPQGHAPLAPLPSSLNPHPSSLAIPHPIPNGKSRTTAPGKNGRNSAKKLWLQPLAKRLKGKKRTGGTKRLARV
jgi:hypothetical protein